MKELSIFIDESGDFGNYHYQNPWYIVAMVFHEQNHSLSRSESVFFGTVNDLKRNYLRIINRQEIDHTL